MPLSPAGTSASPLTGNDLWFSRTAFAACILLSAFLLFQVQPLLAKLILPWFGGSAAVWTACILFFQVTLLAGYGYAHWLSGRRASVQWRVHSALLALSLLALPIVPAAAWQPQGGEDPLWRIVALLAATVGLPFLMLSSTSPLLQAWAGRRTGGAAYRFYAVSNAGSMAGLLTYPVLFEPYLSGHRQAWMWSAGYTVFAALCAGVAWRARGEARQAAGRTGAGAAPAWAERARWLLLAACPSALLLAVTAHITERIAAIPFLWVLPLSLYLLSFILAFDGDRWYRRRVWAPLAAIALPLTGWLVSGTERISDLGLLDLKTSIGLLCGAAFVLFMVCHGELARRRPAPAHLTRFYLMVAAGGAMGGALITVVAPYCFQAVYDLPLVLALTSFVLVELLWDARARQRKGRGKGPRAGYSRPLLAGPVVLTLVTGMAAGFAYSLARETWDSFAYARLLARNFYGSLVVYDNQMPRPKGPVRVLRNGAIDHGEQFLQAENRRYATTYYGRNSGVGRALAALMEQGAVNVGVVGLGAGTLAAYGRPGDRYAFYEINPNVVRIAETQFTFLRDCPAAHEIVEGDARLALEREATRRFDLLALDAFSGDSIPVHLLTRQAFRLYWRHLKADGVLAVHVSNKYLALAPIVALAAAEEGKQAEMVSYGGNEVDEESSSDWVLVTSRSGFFDAPEMRRAAEAVDGIEGLRMWTDDYSGLWRILR